MGPFGLRVVIHHPPRRGRRDDQSQLRGTDRHDEDGQQDAIDEVRALLADIRQSLAEDSASVRLYYERDNEPARSPVHAAIARTRASA
jgi:hypothetical protein